MREARLAIVAIIRKLVIPAYALLRDGRPWTPEPSASAREEVMENLWKTREGHMHGCTKLACVGLA